MMPQETGAVDADHMLAMDEWQRNAAGRLAESCATARAALDAVRRASPFVPPDTYELAVGALARLLADVEHLEVTR